MEKNKQIDELEEIVKSFAFFDQQNNKLEIQLIAKDFYVLYCVWLRIFFFFSI